ncbi:hypothetical protein VNI00_009501 [Paramarasmius palmivorus]|uniref:Uncharacterized protein n=1 Tax=Paramarasmius palmivorus TaxID=297713 RepID=A0AAW0CQF3_9AGAR
MASGPLANSNLPSTEEKAVETTSEGDQNQLVTFDRPQRRPRGRSILYEPVLPKERQVGNDELWDPPKEWEDQAIGDDDPDARELIRLKEIRSLMSKTDMLPPSYLRDPPDAEKDKPQSSNATFSPISSKIPTDDLLKSRFMTSIVAEVEVALGISNCAVIKCPVPRHLISATPILIDDWIRNGYVVDNDREAEQGQGQVELGASFDYPNLEENHDQDLANLLAPVPGAEERIAISNTVPYFDVGTEPALDVAPALTPVVPKRKRDREDHEVDISVPGAAAKRSRQFITTSTPLVTIGASAPSTPLLEQTPYSDMYTIQAGASPTTSSTLPKTITASRAPSIQSTSAMAPQSGTPPGAPLSAPTIGTSPPTASVPHGRSQQGVLGVPSQQDDPMTLPPNNTVDESLTQDYPHWSQRKRHDMDVVHAKNLIAEGVVVADGERKLTKKRDGEDRWPIIPPQIVLDMSFLDSDSPEVAQLTEDQRDMILVWIESHTIGGNVRRPAQGFSFPGADILAQTLPQEKVHRTQNHPLLIPVKLDLWRKAGRRYSQYTANDLRAPRRRNQANTE